MKLVENAIIAGRFRLNHVLGGGGMGAVWHATHIGLDIPCAIKFVKGELAENEDMKARFEREAKAAAHLRSPHVVQILDHGVCEGTPYIAMELLDGEDLGMRLQKRGRLSPEELYKIMNEACRALGKAHAQNIIHRDLKPDNIFLVKDDDREITKVLDFGIAKTITNELGGSGTKTGAMLGTPYYMSPEQAQGTKTVDLRSDLWSLAVICFQCLTGTLPFESEALGDLLVKIIISPIPVPSKIAPVPAGFDKWWAKAASREAADRFQSAKEFSDSLALVCGVSHVSGVIDRNHLRVVAEAEAGARAAQGIQAPQAGGAPAAGGPVPTPATMGDPRVGTPLPAPQASQTSQGTVPAVFPLTQPRAPSAGSAGAPGAAGNTPPAPIAGTGAGATPTPLSRSFAVDPPAKPASRVGLMIALGVGLPLLFATLGGLGWFLARDHVGSASATASTTTAAPANPTASTAAASPSAPASGTGSAAGTDAPSTAATAQASATQPSSNTPSNNGGSPASANAGTNANANPGANANANSGANPNANSGANPNANGGSSSSHGTHSSKPPSSTTTPTKPTKPNKPADMGF
jgi:serine/threonine protein kinase